MALECVRESCVLEGASALAARALAERAADASLREVLGAIAEDEARHAEHGWDALAWLAPQLDAGAWAALEREVARLGRQVPKAPVDHDEWTHLGVAGPTLWGDAVRASVDAARARLDAMRPLRRAA